MTFIIIRKRWIYISIVAIAAILLIILTSGLWNRSITTSSVPSTTKTIIIDAGHGGIDPGAIGKSGAIEKDINLTIAKYLREYLEQSGTTVIMTRETDTGLYTSSGSIRNKKNEDLRNRKNLVKNSKGDLFISIHLNSFPQAQYYGAQTFYSSDNPQGKILAKKIQDEFINTLDKNNTRIALPKDNMYLIKGLDIPAVLVECGFLSNAAEEKKLKNSNYQKKIAWSIYVGIQQYYAEQ
ncbi:N-acetylmuramoyl-L-alanine amidase CwlD [Alkaliphilus peptidifermentans]|uniref:N-acetylmuramoyl-L-alanine amidase n=1 Tax=Alkaliphilus peptidifermentans DSM 18978 TaxID=1120976 RepID=A0A1G5J0N8_9FIRM|nr:N-acetylmuramoyl-L-alanine amidase CwlD [Alkaliphilus peptidifermentans]SCY81389.1 N-acetylmuramoyl-L-alanine amidase [Alkaliphilus peptidifermentans DSM 18978]